MKMARKRLSAEQIVTKLRQIEVLQAQGKTISVACKEAGTTEQNYYRWRKEYGGLGVDCPGSAPIGQNAWLEERRISGSS
jgi:transposase-like protein